MFQVYHSAVTDSAHKNHFIAFIPSWRPTLQLPRGIVNRTSSNCLPTKVQKPVKRLNQTFRLLLFFRIGRELEMLKITRFITNNKNYFLFFTLETKGNKNGENRCGKKRRKNIK